MCEFLLNVPGHLRVSRFKRPMCLWCLQPTSSNGLQLPYAVGIYRFPKDRPTKLRKVLVSQWESDYVETTEEYPGKGVPPSFRASEVKSKFTSFFDQLNRLNRMRYLLSNSLPSSCCPDVLDFSLQAVRALSSASAAER